MEILWGILSGNLIKTKSLHKSVQLHTDGAIARYYSIFEWKSLLKKFFLIEVIKIFGTKTDFVPLPKCKLKLFIIKITLNSINKFFTTKMRMGSFLFSKIKKNIHA